MAAVFDWKRYWCPRGGNFDLSDRGFLSDPDTKWGKVANPDLVQFDQLAARRCLALLGEPGIGKSQDLKRQSLKIEKPIADAGGKLLWLDLRSFSSEDRLENSLFGSVAFEAWRKGDYELHLFLDSLDECLLRIDSVASLLSDELPQQPFERLRLRVICRTLPWPMILESALVRLYGDKEFAAHELVPLKRSDVKDAAQQSGISSPEAFLERIEALAVTPLAIKPVTLNFLINTYLRDGSLPSNQIELYEKGCRILCEESNESRRGSGRLGHLSPEQKMAIASRIGAITQLTNKYAVWTGSEKDVPPEEDVTLGDLVGGVEYGPDEFPISVESIREALDTGLFSSRGQNRIGWAHQTYAEFLAARYCNERRLPLPQIRGLIFHPAHDGKRLVPQLHECAAWVSVMMPEVLGVVADSDPEALLGAAAASLSAEQRTVLVRSILDKSEAGRPLHLRWGMYWLYHKLQHPKLSAQLRAYLGDATKTLPARHVAIDIGRACSMAELGPDLANIALNASEGVSLRKAAAAAAASIGSAQVRGLLRSLAFEQVEPDPDDELKGAGLTALWPELIAVAEIFPLLTNPGNPNLSGLYTSFLASFPGQMSPADLPIALEWFSRQPSRHNVAFALGQLMDKIVLLAWENLDHPGVAEGLADAILSRAVFYDELVSGTEGKSLREELAGNDERRHRLLEALLPRLGEIPQWGLYVAVRLLTFSDFNWLLERILSGHFQSSTSVEAKLVVHVTDSASSERMRALWFACQSSETLNSECQGFFVPIDLDSDIAKMLRDDSRRQGKAKPKLLDPAPAQLIERDLQGIEDGGVTEGWLRLAADLSLEPTSTHYKHDLEPDLTSMPGWQAAEGSTRGRTLAAARRYVDEADPQNDGWFHTSSTPYVALGGVRALALLLSKGREGLQGVTVESWRKWVPALLRYPVYDGEQQQGKRSLKNVLLLRAYLSVPEEVIARLMQEIDRNNEQNGYFLTGNEIEVCLDDRMGKVLLGKVTDAGLKSQVVAALLQLLIHHSVAGARELAESLITSPVPKAEPQRGNMLAAIQALMTEAPDAGWPKVWPAMRRTRQFGRLVVESVSYGNLGRGGFIGKLTEKQLGKLYLWMVRNYPYAEHSGLRSGAMGPVDTAVMLRDGILEHLKKRAGFAACDALRDVVEKLPQYPGLRHQLEEAEALARAATWQPITARQFLTLVFDGTKRLIENGEQLIEVVLESLARLGSELHDELSPVRYLWFPSNGGHRPRDEEDLSGYVVSHLKRDLKQRAVIVNREVQIRRRIGRAPGQSTDIHVDAVTAGMRRDSYDQLHAIIEVKGNWHRELLTAMETQLRDRYLRNNRCKYGIYLVGWFSCSSWDRKDSRRRKCSRMSVDEAKEFFAEQAKGLSTDGYVIKSYVMNLSLGSEGKAAPPDDGAGG